MIDFLRFDFLITPYIIGFVYFFGAIIIPFLVLFFAKKYNLHIHSYKVKFYMLSILLLCELLWRIFCEFFMVYFKLLGAMK